MGDYLDVLSEFVAETRYEDLGDDAIAAIKEVILDTVGAIVAGSRLPENEALAQMASQRSRPGTATILGHGLKAEPMWATLANATAGVALEMDEGNRFGGGHPAIHSLPGALAIAEELGTDGKKFMESVLVGYELESRVGGATRPRPNVHSHGHWGTVGTATAVAKLRGYGSQDIRKVINLAASMSPANTWTTAFSGATIRNLYPGRSGLQGILAANLYECGFTGLEDAPSDVFGTIIGDRFDSEAVIQGLGGEYRIQQNYFKFYACCRINHPSLDAVLEARGGSDLRPEDVESVDIDVRSMLEGMLGPYPDNMLAAKFNVPYAVAAALIRGSLDITAFEPQTINDSRIRDLAAKVHVRVDPELASDHGGELLARASIRLRVGQVLRGTTKIVRGDYGNRVPRQELLDKSHLLNDPVLGTGKAQEVIDAIDRLDGMPDIRRLTTLLCA